MERSNNLLFQVNGFNIYQFNSSLHDMYFLAIPLSSVTKYEICMGLAQGEVNSFSEDVIFHEFAGLINDKANNVIYALPVVDVTYLKEAANENDMNRSYFPMFQRIYSTVYDVNQRIHEVLGDNVLVDPVINIVKQTSYDAKFFQWLETANINGVYYGQFFRDASRKIDYSEYMMDDDNGEVGPVNMMGSNDSQEISQNKGKKKVKTKQAASHHGFGTFNAICLIFGFSLSFATIIWLFLNK